MKSGGALAPGELTTEEHERDEARLLFLAAVEELAPRVLKDLYENVFTSPEIAGNQLTEWADRFGVREDWVLEQARLTLDVWASAIPNPKPAEWDFVTDRPTWGFIAAGRGELVREFGMLFRWFPTAETKEAVRHRLHAQVNRFIDESDEKARLAGLRDPTEFRDRRHPADRRRDERAVVVPSVVADLDERGCDELRVRRTRKIFHGPLRHFAWLALQVGGMGIEEIELALFENEDPDRIHRDSNTIRKGVRRAAAILGLSGHCGALRKKEPRK